MDASGFALPTYLFSDYRLISATMRLERDGIPVSVTPRVFSTLLYLVENAGRTVTKDEMLCAIWPGRIAEEANLSQAISTARRVLGADQNRSGLILTIPGLGYRFSAAVSIEASAGPKVQDPLHSQSVSLPASKRPMSLRLAWIAGAIGAMVLGLGVAWMVAGGRQPPSPPVAPRSAVVIADLQNFTGEKTFDHVIAPILQIDLGQSPFLQITPDAKISETLSLMEQPKDAPLTPALALAICARTNASAVIVPAIARLGDRYLLTLAASDCVNGKPLFDEKQDVIDKDSISHAADMLSALMRRRLGELGASISHFDVPMASERTSSFAALRAYSEAEWMRRQGKTLESIPFYRHAVDLDPDFTVAYLGLSLAYYGTWQTGKDALAITEAYKRRATVSERNALLIDNRYNMRVTKNYDAALQSATLLSRLYPNDVAAWSTLSNLQIRMGDLQGAIASARRAIELDPQRSPSYTELARALIHNNQLPEAEKVDDQASRVGPKSGVLLQQEIALRFMLGDQIGSERLVQSAAGTPLEREALLEGYNFAVASGRLRRAAQMMERANQLGRADGLQRKYAEEAFNAADFGLVEQGRALLAQIPPDLWSGEDDYYAAILEEPKTAEADLKRDLARWPDDTLLNAKYAPEARAELLLRSGKPEEALHVLDAATRFMSLDLDAPYLRASVLLAAKNPSGATAAFRAILTQTGYAWDPQFWLSHLGAARALRMAGNLGESRREYEAFLAVWRNADPDLDLVRQARAEYAALRPSQPAKVW